MKTFDALVTATSKNVMPLYWVIFLLSVALRITLAWINPVANDNHMEVVQIILQTGSLPTKNDCWECFQPKLYHATIAGFFRILSITSPDQQVLFANMLNALFGTLTLGVIGGALIRSNYSPLFSLLAFSYISFNPKLIAINAQATNDTLLIFFSSMALYFFNNYQTQNKKLYFFLATLFVVLSASAKSNGVIIFLAILLVLILKFIFDVTRRKSLLLYVGMYSIVCPLLIAVNPLNQYIQNYKQYGMPVLLNIPRRPIPNFVEPTFPGSPGIISVMDGFFTFKLDSLLAHPRIERCIECPKMAVASGELAHRTSLWTQLYARAHSVNFDNWPPAWATQEKSLFPLLRAIYLFALLPTSLIVLGAVQQLGKLMRSFWSNDLQIANRLLFGVYPITLLGYVCFIILYALMWRDFTVMKIVFIYPALSAFPFVFLAALEERSVWFIRFLFGSSLVLFCLYIADVASLMFRLI